MAPKSLRMTDWGYKTGKRLLKGFTSQKGRERMYNYKFSQINAPGKVMAWT